MGMDRDETRDEMELRLAAGWRPRAFAAIDFETANSSRNSACAAAVVRVEGQRIVGRRSTLIRPPTADFQFTHIHGICWSDVRTLHAFHRSWRSLADLLNGIEFMAAHNAGFDRGVLHACCDHSQMAVPPTPFVCTVKLARLCWGIRPTKLPNVCAHLGLSLDHHDPLSDAEACAGIVLAAMGKKRQGP